MWQMLILRFGGLSRNKVKTVESKDKLGVGESSKGY